MLCDELQRSKAVQSIGKNGINQIIYALHNSKIHPAKPHKHQGGLKFSTHLKLPDQNFENGTTFLYYLQQRCLVYSKKISVVSTISTVSSLRPTSPTGTPLSPQHQQAKTSANQHKRIIRSLLAVVFVFFLCMTPFCVTKLVKVRLLHISQGFALDPIPRARPWLAKYYG